MPTLNLHLLLPEIILTVTALFVMLGEASYPKHRKLWMSLSALAVLAAGYFVLSSLCTRASGEALGMAVVNAYTGYFKMILLGAVLLVMAMFWEEKEFSDISYGTLLSLLLFSSVGLLLLVSSSDLLMVLISFELIGVTSFILTGAHRRSIRSNEAAIKFFLIGAFSSGLMLYGISWVYGLLGSTRLETFWAAREIVPAHLWPAFILAVVFILAGIGFKLAMVPFHMWVPDTYEGAPTPVTAFLSVAPKVAAFGFLVRFIPDPHRFDIGGLLAILAAITMTLGNFSALHQTNIKRLLAYSSIAQMGYILVGFVAAGTSGMSSVMIYAMAYTFMNLGVFACVIAVTNTVHSEKLDAFKGLSRRSFGLSMAMVLFLLSLTGIPPLIGFIGKFTLFAAAVESAQTLNRPWLIWLVVVAVINSVVSLYYYFRIVHYMFFLPPQDSTPLPCPPFLKLSLAVTLGITVIIGIFPKSLISIATYAMTGGLYE